jgi:two-component system C4-dicarboxylate transport sensor histidine kinase DctB
MSSVRDLGPESTQDWLEMGRLGEIGLLSMVLLHELRQPLFALSALLQLAEAADPAAANSEHLKAMVDPIRQIERLIETFGGLGDRTDGPAVPFLIDQTVDSALATMGHRARRLGVRLDGRLDSNLPVALGKPAALLQVLVALIQNALDAARDSDPAWVEVHAHPDSDGVVVRVRDSGSGIPLDRREQVFEPFFTTKPTGEGTGLGLAVARRLVAGFGGRLELAGVGVDMEVLVWLPTVGT